MTRSESRDSLTDLGHTMLNGGRLLGVRHLTIPLWAVMPTRGIPTAEPLRDAVLGLAAAGFNESWRNWLGACGETRAWWQHRSFRSQRITLEIQVEEIDNAHPNSVLFANAGRDRGPHGTGRENP